MQHLVDHARDSITADDLAIEAAKEKLVALTDRDEYRAALAQVRRPDRGARIAVQVGFAIFGLATLAFSWIASGLVWIAVMLFAAMTIVFGLAMIGYAQDRRAQGHGAAVLAKTVDKYELVLLLVDGNEIKASVGDAIYNAVKPGDVGVVWLRKRGDEHVATDLERL
jgi:hypothetical protein